MDVYVDDLMLAAGKGDEARLWAEIEEHVKFGEPPAHIATFLGGSHCVQMEGGFTNLTTNMTDFLLDAAERFRNQAGLDKLAYVRTPYLDEDFTSKGTEAQGLYASVVKPNEHIIRSPALQA